MESLMLKGETFANIGQKPEGDKLSRRAKAAKVRQGPG
jgi:hypothetical protein